MPRSIVVPRSNALGVTSEPLGIKSVANETTALQCSAITVVAHLFGSRLTVACSRLASARAEAGVVRQSWHGQLSGQTNSSGPDAKPLYSPARWQHLCALWEEISEHNGRIVWALTPVQIAALPSRLAMFVHQPFVNSIFTVGPRTTISSTRRGSRRSLVQRQRAAR